MFECTTIVFSKLANSLGGGERVRKEQKKKNMQRALKLKGARNLDADLSASNSICSLPYVLIPDEVVQRLTS
jgi:hypothetical protein